MYTEDSAKSTFGEIFDLLADRKLKQVLVDCRYIENLHNVLLNSFEYAEFIANEIQAKNIYPKLAYILLKDSHFDIRQFAEDVAVNRGVNIKLFVDRDEALTWLEGGKYYNI